MFRCKCYTPEIHGIAKLKYRGTDSNQTKIWIWNYTARYQETCVFWFGGFWGCNIFSGTYHSSVLQCVAVCCKVLQCVTVCCSVLQCVAVRCSVLQWVAVCCSVLQCVSVCCSVLLMWVLCHFTGFARLVWGTSKCLPTQWRRPIAYLIFIHHCPQKRTRSSGSFVETDLQSKAGHCNTLQHTVTHCNTLQHTATHSLLWKLTCNLRQVTATHCNTL